LKTLPICPIAVAILLVVTGCRHDPAPAVTPPTVSPSTSVQTKSNLTESDLGLPFYPGSTEKGTSSRVMDTDKARTVICDRITSEAPQKVADFYFTRLKGAKKSTLPNMMLIGGTLEDGSAVSIQAAHAGPHRTEIGISVIKAKTKNAKG